MIRCRVLPLLLAVLFPSVIAAEGTICVKQKHTQLEHLKFWQCLQSLKLKWSKSPMATP